MQVAFTLDDIPLWPMSYPPEGYSAGGIVDSIIAALARNGIRGVYGFANSWALVQHPEMSRILDTWTDAGHFVGNHTHSHLELNGSDSAHYMQDIDIGERHIVNWMAKAPTRFFRHPICYWGDTDEKRLSVKAHLAGKRYTVAEVTSWYYEWRWNRAFLNCRQVADQDGVAFLRSSFPDFAVAQLRYDFDCANQWFRHQVTPIILGHTLPFFADIADDLFRRLVAEGISFVSLEEAACNAAYRQIASVAIGEFLVYHQKLAGASGRPMAAIVPSHRAVFDRVTEMTAGRTD